MTRDDKRLICEVDQLLYQLVCHLVDEGSIGLGTPQAKLLLEAKSKMNVLFKSQNAQEEVSTH